MNENFDLEKKNNQRTEKIRRPQRSKQTEQRNMNRTEAKQKTRALRPTTYVKRLTFKTWIGRSRKQTKIVVREKNIFYEWKRDPKMVREIYEIKSDPIGSYRERKTILNQIHSQNSSHSLGGYWVVDRYLRLIDSTWKDWLDNRVSWMDEIDRKFAKFFVTNSPNMTFSY